MSERNENRATTPSANQEPTPLWSTSQAAAFLGVHAKTVLAWTRTRDLPCVRLGNRLRFVPDDVLRWVLARKE